MYNESKNWEITKYASNGDVLSQRSFVGILNMRALQDWCNDQQGRRALAVSYDNPQDPDVQMFEYTAPTWRGDWSCYD